MSGTPNQLTPRQLAIAHVDDKTDEVRRLILKHRAEHPDDTDLFHSQIRVFLEQVAVELQRAAEWLKTHDMSEDG